MLPLINMKLHIPNADKTLKHIKSIEIASK